MKTKEILNDLNVPIHMIGYRSLLIAVQLYRSDPEQFVTKELYPEVARRLKYRSNSVAVEKNIRYSINAAWEKRDPEKWERYFPGGEKPSNLVLIARVAEEVDEE